ncbi:MAG: MATE family efflux transporter [Lachnospiraceae bacterium]
MHASSHEMDMCHGPLFSKIIVFAIPVILSGVLQLLFNATDMIIIGQYDSTNALAALGSVTALINFFVNLMMGISIGANVIVARYYGAKKWEELHDAVHTSISISLLAGVTVAVLAILLSRPILMFMDTPDDVIDLAALYIRIYFIGLPFSMLYNFGSAILRAVGDTKRPLLYLAISGVINVLLNYIFVKYLHLSVAGVALATILSQAISAFFVIRDLYKEKGEYKLIRQDLRIHPRMLKQILQVGLPAGIQSMLFSISNILIQASINSFGSVAMAGNTACASIEGFVYMSMNAIYQTNISFSSQNYGAGNYKRMDRSLLYCLLLVTGLGLSLGFLVTYFGHPLLSLYNDEEAVIQYGLDRMSVICTTYFTCGIMEVLVGSLRGMGYGILPMIVSLIGVCGLRILWIATYFAEHHTLKVLYLSYPITWCITILAHAICFFIIRQKLRKS